MTKAGKARGWTIRYWNEHVEGMSSPDAIFSMGTIHKTRVSWNVYVISRNYSGADDYELRRRYGAHGEDKWYTYSHWACVVHKSTGERVVDQTAHTKEQAFGQARNLLGTAERRGSTVEWGEDAALEAPELAPKSSLTAFVQQVDDAIAGNKLADVLITLETLDEFLSLVPILQAKRAALQEHGMELMTLDGFVPRDSDEQQESQDETAV